MTERDRAPLPDERDERTVRTPPPPPPESAEDPAPGVEHKPEPDAENIMPVKHEPGTL